jgi:hypothetical protein
MHGEDVSFLVAGSATNSAPAALTPGGESRAETGVIQTKGLSGINRFDVWG